MMTDCMALADLAGTLDVPAFGHLDEPPDIRMDTIRN